MKTRSVAAQLVVALNLGVAAIAMHAGAAVPAITYTASGQHVALGYPGERLALPGGEQLRNQVEILRTDSTDVRLAGRRILLTHGLEKTDGTRELSGTWIGEPGTWAAGAFTPSGGLWDGTWRGTRRADGSLALTLTARGSGGSFDGLELKESMTRAGGTEFDPALRYEMTGRTATTDGWVQTIFADDFEDGIVDPAWRPPPGSAPPKNTVPRLAERNGQLTLYLEPAGGVEVDSMLAVIGVGRTITLQDGQTVELRCDLAGMTGTTSQLRGTGLSLAETSSPDADQAYYTSVVTTGTVLGKNPGFETDLYARDTFSVFYRAGITVILSVSRLDASTAKLHLRLVDRNRNGAVVWDVSWTDTQSIDRVSYGSDIEAPPYLSFVEAGFFFGFVPTSPQQPPKDLSLSIDNFSLRVFETSAAELQIERAVLLTPPPFVQRYVVETAPTVNGPWTELSTPEVMIDGVRRLLIPVSQNPGTRLFRGH